jgi:hypothetical protein
MTKAERFSNCVCVFLVSAIQLISDFENKHRCMNPSYERWKGKVSDWVMGLIVWFLGLGSGLKGVGLINRNRRPSQKPESDWKGAKGRWPSPRISPPTIFSPFAKNLDERQLTLSVSALLPSKKEPTNNCPLQQSSDLSQEGREREGFGS